MTGDGRAVVAIETARLVLRRARPEDAEALHPILSDPAAMLYWSSVPHRDMAETRAFLAPMLAPGPGSDEFIVERDGQAIGKFGAWRGAELGFIFDRRVWGQGYGFEAGQAFLCYADRRGLGPLTADVDPRNAASIRLLHRLGFAETGRASNTFSIAGQWVDSVYFARPPASV